MSVVDDTRRVIRNINNIYERRRIGAIAISINYAAMALNYFQSVQLTGTGNAGLFWVNRTEAAARAWFSNAFHGRDFVGWFVAQGLQYGLYLELANDRRNESLRKVIQRFARLYIRDIRRLYS